MFDVVSTIHIATLASIVGAAAALALTLRRRS